MLQIPNGKKYLESPCIKRKNNFSLGTGGCGLRVDEREEKE
jgi:hypothetical protein